MEGTRKEQDNRMNTMTGGIRKHMTTHQNPDGAVSKLPIFCKHVVVVAEESTGSMFPAAQSYIYVILYF